jgi:hypothetical protein
MRVLHGLVLALVAVAFGARALLEEPDSFAITGPALLLAFVVTGGAAALDVLDRRWRWLAVDAAVAAVAVVTVLVR